MKKFFAFMLMALVSVSAFASVYEVECNTTTQKVTITKDGKIIQGKANSGECKALFSLELRDEKIACKLEKILDTQVPNLGYCTVEKDGTARFMGLSYQDKQIKQAFNEAMKYLKDTNSPIKIKVFQD